jgi:2-pyrone-4,6-dicarboxylate lactonase
VVVYFEAQDLPELWDFFTALPTTVVVDHMGRPDVAKPVDGPEFERFVRLLAGHRNIWSKVSCPERLSRSGPPGYDDVVPFGKRLVDTFPDRVLWGTDWPHPNMKTHMPDDGALVDFLPRIATTTELRRSSSWTTRCALLELATPWTTTPGIPRHQAPSCSTRRSRSTAITSTCSACR